MTLDSIPKQKRARVIAVDTSGSGGLRLMEMGLIPGASVRVVKSAPLGDPIQILVGNYHLALRRQEARGIQVTLSEE